MSFALFFSLWIARPLAGQDLPVIIELENGTVGGDFSVSETEGGTYVSITTNGTAGHPEADARVITVDITFPEAQTYDLYVRLRVGAGGADDDSFFYGNGFGIQPYADAGWIRANNIHSIGYTAAGETVSGAGGAGQSVWKWINLSEYSGDEAPRTFEVTADALTQTFQIGAREDGLDIDKIAFARADYFYTVQNLDLVEAGSPDMDGGGPGLPPIAEGQDKFLGNVYSTSQLPGFANYWNQVTPENAGKWGSVEGSPDNMNWAALDAAYALAKDNDFPFKLHVLVWGNQQPAWIENLPPAEQLEEIKEWFQALADRYEDIDFIEVVNEPLHDPPNSSGSGGGNYLEALGGAGSSGWDWILEAFRLARQYFPEAELMLNDYNIVNSASNVRDYLEIINLLQAEELIDQIGVQAHAFSTRNASASQLRNNLDDLAETGLPLYVTELDIDGATDQGQLAEYQRVFPVFWEHPAVRGITLWGFRTGMWRTEQRAYLVDQDGVTERPALVWLRGYVESSPVSVRPPLGSADRISIYPNPLSGGPLKVEGLEGPTGVQLFNSAGTLVRQAQLNGNTFELQRDLPPGLYLLKLQNQQQVYTKKLMVK
ncbi:glycoside hydrolase [Flavilitoribacter nigricans DSM 23189 = NBRC 102662]|uniref:endo-1,4-beta-xylanase n=1 Tax=Flavilitoribacter nigricans (strain ATCC 23147 / DSM 23189 / NBRC 102662 / NCIMB 1420 / SS-2) TaxID=1122177 RepID=A0A2D0MZI3_FLAN2|nr:glycoside hydrolase [Flavilitoribacter nigricans DSM 23189 = NBRC 102662]